jgi:hypothetical protein
MSSSVLKGLLTINFLLQNSQPSILPSRLESFTATHSSEHQTFVVQEDFALWQCVFSPIAILGKIKCRCETSIALAWFYPVRLVLAPKTKNLLASVSFWTVCRYCEHCGNSTERIFGKKISSNVPRYGRAVGVCVQSQKSTLEITTLSDIFTCIYGFSEIIFQRISLKTRRYKFRSLSGGSSL